MQQIIMNPFTIQIKMKQTKEPVTRIQKLLHQDRINRSKRLGIQHPYNDPLLNTINQSYTGNVFLGTPLQGSSATEFTFDTGSGYLDVMDSSCTTCKTSFYNPQASSTYSNSTTYSTTTISYGSATVDGYMAVDNVCLSSDNDHTCVSQFNFFLVTQQSGLSKEDGILGLCPPYSTNGPSFFKALIQEQNMSPQLSFAMGELQDSGQLSYVTFGGADKLQYSGDLIAHQTVVTGQYTQWWTLNLTGATFGSTNLMQSYVTSYAIVDTGTSLLLLETSAYDLFSSQVEAATGMNCKDSFCYSANTTCSSFYSSLPDIVIQLNGTPYSIPPQGYMISNNGAYACQVMVSSIEASNGFYVLGDTFIRNYYAVFDFQDFTVSLATATHAPKMANLLTGWDIFGIVIGCLVAIVLLTWLTVWTVRKCKKPVDEEAVVDELGPLVEDGPQEVINE